jgi:cell division protein FtsB
MKFVNYKILIGAVVVIALGFFLINTIKNLFQIQRSGSVVEELENELDRKQSHNKFLQEQLKYVQTNEFIERESREKLGLVKKGEVVVQEKLESSINVDIEQNLSRPNWKQWLELFM